MGVRVIVYREAADDSGGEQGALLFDSTSGVPFPIEAFGSADEAELFLQWLEEDKDIEDARKIGWSDLDDLQTEWWKLNGTIPSNPLISTEGET